MIKLSKKPTEKKMFLWGMAIDKKTNRGTGTMDIVRDKPP